MVVDIAKMAERTQHIVLHKVPVLGGIAQRVLIDTYDMNNPVVIELHGGPGLPLPLNPGTRSIFADWARQFTMVYWDQLGCGINNDTLDESLSIQRFVDMTLDLILYIRSHFPNRKIFLLALSWGSILSAKISQLRPDLIDGVVVYGQAVRNVEGSQQLFDALEHSRLPRFLKNAIVKAHNPVTRSVPQMQLIMGCSFFFTQSYHTLHGDHVPLIRLSKAMLVCEDYRYKDILALALNGYMSNTSIFKELAVADVADELVHAIVPYWIVQGANDLVTDTKSIRELVETSGNSNLRIHVLAHASHLPGVHGMHHVLLTLEEMERMCSAKSIHS